MEPHVQTVPVFSLGEGPHWDTSKGELYFVDTFASKVNRFNPTLNQHTSVTLEGGVVTLVIPVEGQQNQYVVSVGRSLSLMEWDGVSGTPTSLSNLFTVEPEHPQNILNDGKCDSKGRLWVGTVDATGGRSASLYRVDGRSAIQAVEGGIGTSNGMAWNNDETLLYYIDTKEMKVDVFDFDLEQGAISNRRTVYDFVASGEAGAPDGMNIDSEGKLWVACLGGKQIIQVDPAAGRKMKTVPLSTTNITSIAFGGPNLDVMYVTSGFYGLSEEDKKQQSAAGSLFQITNTGSRGISGGHSFKLSS